MRLHTMLGCYRFKCDREPLPDFSLCEQHRAEQTTLETIRTERNEQ